MRKTTTNTNNYQKTISDIRNFHLEGNISTNIGEQNDTQQSLR